MSMSELLRPLEYASHKWRVMNITKNKDKASLAFYIDARDVMDRLDAVVGGENWQDKYTVLAYSDSRWAVECTLVVNGVAKTDVGEGDAPKDAYSDALKRAAVKFGIGRYLYDMDTGNWFAIDEWKNFTPDSKKQIDELLRRNLSRLGVESQPHALRKEPATVTTTTPAGAATNGTTTGNVNANGSTNGHGGADDERETARKSFMATGSELFGAQWSDARHWLVQAYTMRYTPDKVRKSSTELGTTELRDMAKMLKDDGAKYVESWNKYNAKLNGITVNGAQEMAH